MKIKEVPQDLKFFKNNLVRDVAYAVDDSGNYTTVISDGWEVKNDALDITWENINNNCDEIRQKVLSGELSPFAFHLEKNLMNISLFAKYSGHSKRKIKQLLKPENFNKLDDDILRKYAEILRISVEELKTV